MSLGAVIAGEGSRVTRWRVPSSPVSRAGNGAAVVVLENLTAPVFSGKHYHHQHILACNLPHLLLSRVGLVLMVHF